MATTLADISDSATDIADSFRKMQYALLAMAGVTTIAIILITINLFKQK